MELSHEIIKSFSTEQYKKYRKEIKEFYKNQRKTKRFIKKPTGNPIKTRYLKNGLWFQTKYVNNLTLAETKKIEKYWAIHPNEKGKKKYYDCPWMKHARSAKQRCTNPKATSFIYYGAKGIKYILSNEDIKKLWFRDKAYEMKQPTLDRIDGLYNYTFENCQFLEKSDNSKKARKERNLLRLREKYNPNGDWIQLHKKQI